MNFDWTETGLRLLGLSLATTSLFFAVHMTMNERKPDINGIEHLAIYAKPTTRASQRATTGVDYMATGSIAIKIIDASSRFARVSTPSGVKTVAVGERFGAYGRIRAIERTGEKWRIVTERAIIVDREAPRRPAN